MRQALPLVLVFAAAAAAQLPSDGRNSYSRSPDISIPFDLRAGGPASKVTLYYNFDGGPWREYDSATPGGKQRFAFKADREGPYGFATLTTFKDGTTDPASPDRLVEQKRVVFDRTPPRVASVRPVSDANGNPGIEWDVTDDNPDPRGLHLEFRWDGQGRFEPIDKNVRFNYRDSRYWKLKPRERMQVKVVAVDRAGNKAESEPVWVSASDAGGSDPAPVRTTGSAAGAVRDPAVAPAAGTAQPSLHYLNTRTVKVSVNATVGPSGLQGATLWWADEKLEWKKWKDEKGKMPIVGPVGPDGTGKVPVDFTFEAPNGDGLYSFVIVVRNHRKPNRRDPKNGEPGEFQVMVDTTRPTVAVTSTQVSPAGERGALVDIRWKAEDKNIAPLPIKLEFQALKPEGGAGPWTPVAQGWVDNTGQHTWTVPTGEGHLFNFRVTCRDRAGNESQAITQTPVNTDLSVPGVDAVDVKPGDGKPAMSDVHIGPGK